MKKLLFTPLLFVCQIVIGQVLYSDSVIGKPIRMGKIEVAQSDFSKRMDWKDAKEACANLGNGWRLPTKKEISKIYKNKDEIGGFASKDYWSSTVSNTSFAWGQSFYGGNQFDGNKSSLNYVRAVRFF